MGLNNLGGCYPPRPTASTITPSSISIILHKILDQPHSLIVKLKTFLIITKTASRRLLFPRKKEEIGAGLQKNTSLSFGQAAVTFPLPGATYCWSYLMILLEDDLPGI